MKILFLYLTAFSTNGGIEKFNKAFMKSLNETEGVNFKAFSTHDSGCDSRYLSLEYFKGFSGNKVLFGIESVAEAGKHDTIILGHINLAPMGIFIKKLYPDKKLILITHGIEVWDKVNILKKQLLQEADKIITVSQFTGNKLMEKKINSNKICILHNTIDPYFDYPRNFEKPDFLKLRYNIDRDEKVILTVCRISSAEKYKGYDKVIETLPGVIKIFPGTKYLLVGKHDEIERRRILEKINNLNLKDNVILTGFIPDSELVAHYLLADVFAMPSSGEGFGIVFLEAMACGLPVITGNNDGSKEILEMMNYGSSVDPDNLEELSSTIISRLKQEIGKEIMKDEVEKIFGFKNYKTTIRNLLKLEQEEIIAA